MENTSEKQAQKWISMAEHTAWGPCVVTTPCISPFKEAMKQAHRSITAKFCPLCGKQAVVNLAPHLLAKQPDNTTHVCHPVLGGCNQGFGR